MNATEVGAGLLAYSPSSDIGGANTGYGAVASGHLLRTISRPIIYEGQLALGGTTGQGTTPSGAVADASFRLGLGGHGDGLAFTYGMGIGWSPFYGTAGGNVYWPNGIRMVIPLTDVVSLDLGGDLRFGTKATEAQGSLGAIFPKLANLGVQLRYSQLLAASWATTGSGANTGAFLSFVLSWSQWEFVYPTYVAPAPPSAPASLSIWYQPRTGHAGQYHLSRPQANCPNQQWSGSASLVRAVPGDSGLDLNGTDIAGIAKRPGTILLQVHFSSLRCMGQYYPDQDVEVQLDISGDAPPVRTR